MILAEATTDFSWSAIGWILIGLAALAAAANQIDDFLKRRQPKLGAPPNEQLQQSIDAMAKKLQEDMERNWHEHRDIFSKIGGVERGAAANLQKAIDSGNVSREKLHTRINELMSAIARLEGKLER